MGCARQEGRYHRPDPFPQVLSTAQYRKATRVMGGSVCTLGQASTARTFTVYLQGSVRGHVPLLRRCGCGCQWHFRAFSATHQIERDVSDVTAARDMPTAVADAGSSPLLLRVMEQARNIQFKFSLCLYLVLNHKITQRYYTLTSSTNFPPPSCINTDS
jgi:hypothetical protein